MARTSRSRNSPTNDTTLAIRAHNPLAQNDITTPVASEFIPTQADRCPFPDCKNSVPHQHAAAEGKITPSIDDYRKAGEAIREHWTQEQRRRLAENEAVLRQLAEIEPKVGSLSIKTHLPRGNDLTVEEQIAIIHGGATPAQYETAREILIERHRQDIIDNTSPISPVFPADSAVKEIKELSQPETNHTSSIEWDDFPELDAKYPSQPLAQTSPLPNPTPTALQNPPTKFSRTIPKRNNPTPLITPRPFTIHQKIDFLNTESLLCTGPCPIQTPHNQGAYLQQGHVPRVWNERWGYSDPPREIWEAWARIEQGHGRTWDEVEVDGFALSHWWSGP